MEIIIKDMEDMPRAASEFLKAIGENKIIALRGKMGAGKTTLVAENTVHVPSPIWTNSISSMVPAETKPFLFGSGVILKRAFRDAETASSSVTLLSATSLAATAFAMALAELSLMTFSRAPDDTNCASVAFAT